MQWNIFQQGFSDDVMPLYTVLIGITRAENVYVLTFWIVVYLQMPT